MTAQLPILHNVRILDFSWALAGPYATRLLGDFGAEVIKVQPPLTAEDEDAFARGYYNTWNRNKLGITLNMNKPEGIALAERLAAISDAVVENFTPRVMANWGLDYAHLKKIKPDIIMVSMSVMGQRSPRSYYTGYGATVHALSGMTALTSLPGKPPLGPGFSYADHLAGLYAAMALLAALQKRSQTGKGQHIDIAEVEVMKGLLDDAGELKPAGNTAAAAAPHNVYRCKGENGWCAIAILTETAWRGLKQALGKPKWAEDRQFSTSAGRLKNRDKLDKMIAAWTREHTAAEAMSLLQKNGVAAGVVNDAAVLADDPQLKARGFFAENEEIPLTDATPIKMSASRAAYRLAAPTQGRDNDYIYGKLLGLSAPEMVGLKRKGVI